MYVGQWRHPPSGTIYRRNLTPFGFAKDRRRSMGRRVGQDFGGSFGKIDEAPDEVFGGKNIEHRTFNNLSFEAT